MEVVQDDAYQEQVTTEPTPIPTKRKSERGIVARSITAGAVVELSHEGKRRGEEGEPDPDNDAGLESRVLRFRKKTKLEIGEEQEEDPNRKEDGKSWRVVEIATRDELVGKGGRGMLVRRPELGHRLAAFWHRDRPHIIDDACPHRGAPLSEGDIEDLVVATCSDGEEEGHEGAEEDQGIRWEASERAKAKMRCGGAGHLPHIVCPLHFYKYDITSGRCFEGHDWSQPLGVYEAWVEGDSVVARLPVLPPITDEDDDDDNHDEDD